MRHTYGKDWVIDLFHCIRISDRTIKHQPRHTALDRISQHHFAKQGIGRIAPGIHDNHITGLCHVDGFM